MDARKKGNSNDNAITSITLIEIVMPQDKVLTLEKTKHRPIGFKV